MSIGRRVSTLAWAAMVVLGLAATGSEAKKLDDAEIRIEINSTDGDAGIHVLLDGEGWDTMQMTGPDGAVMFSVAGDNSIGQQGITEFFFESAEPSFDVQTLDELLALFPAGKYRFRGTTTEGKILKGKARLNHRIPDSPTQLSPVDGASVDPENLVLEWAPVADPPGGEIVGYEVVVECEEPDFAELLLQVGPDVNSVTVPPELLSQEDVEECKWEILAIEDGGNQTISETPFELE